jgi:hypothetical protein
MTQADVQAVVKHSEKLDELLGIHLPVTDEDGDRP